MRSLHLILFVMILLPMILCGCSKSSVEPRDNKSSVESRDNKDKIVGTWEMNDSGMNQFMIFSKDGTLTIVAPSLSSSSRPTIETGQWSVDGETITFISPKNTNAHPETDKLKIDILNDSLLVLEGKNKDGSTIGMVLKRLK